jgi:hypothetical protein
MLKFKQQISGGARMNDYTHICIVLDASGSMSCIENETKTSFNRFLDEQRKLQGKTVVDLYQFADNVNKIIDSVDLSKINEDLMSKYCCRGNTALHDAVCTAIDTLGKELTVLHEDSRPEHVLFAIITDGEENASRHFTLDDVKQRIKHQTEVYSWDFDFLAANQDAFATGTAMGLVEEQCVQFSLRDVGTVASRLSDRSFSIRKKK